MQRIALIKIQTQAEFTNWLRNLKDQVARAAIVKRLERASMGNLGLVESVGDGISEMKVDVGQGYRVYFKPKGKVLVILLCGGSKRSQSADIKRAKAIAKRIGM